VSDEAQRLFFAVQLGAELCAEARVVVEALRERAQSVAQRRDERGESRSGKREVDLRSALRFQPPENWHLTLRFLGPVAAAPLEKLLRGAREALASQQGFSLRLGAAIALPERRPQVIALSVGAEADDALAQLAATLNDVAQQCGFESEDRRFLPHVTLARLRRGVRGAALRAWGVATFAAAGEAVQRVREAVLFRSDLQPGGAQYTPLERLALGGVLHP